MTTDQQQHHAKSPIRSRRAELGLTMAQVARRGGPTKPTQVRYEKGDIPSGSQAGTLAKYDHALEWPAGTTARVLGLPEAPPAEVIPIHPEMPAGLPPGPQEMAQKGIEWVVDSSKLTDLLHGISALRKQLKEIPPAFATPGVAEALEAVTDIQSDILLDHLHHQEDGAIG